jgi:spermidine/putrescine transport system permease protein
LFNIRAWFLLPVRSTIALLFVAPLAIIVAYSLLSRGDYGGVEHPWTIESYLRLFDPLYGTILLRSCVLAAITTVLCAIFGFPLALFISRSGRWKNLWLQLVILPFWTSFLVRTYAWLFLLRETGLINTLLIKAGLIHAPLALLYNDGAVLLGLVYVYLPFMVLPLYGTLERMDPALLEAAADLGMRPVRAIFRIVLPLSMPGMVAGGILVFIPCLGAYLTPDLLGGGKTVMAGNLIQNQFTTARDWPFGSAVSLVLMAISIVMLWVLMKRTGEEIL